MNDQVQKPNKDDLKNQMEYAEKQLDDLTNKEKVLLFDLDQVLASKRFFESRKQFLEGEMKPKVEVPEEKKVITNPES